MKFRQTVAMLMTALAAWTVCSCLPSGDPPEGNIVAPPKQIACSSKEGAVEHMSTVIGIKCGPIAQAAKPPITRNEFVCCDQDVANLPIDLWNKLVDMNLVKPYDDSKLYMPKYKLVSKIERIETRVEPDVLLYRWNIRLLSVMDADTEVWQETLEFSLPKQTQSQPVDNPVEPPK